MGGLSMEQLNRIFGFFRTMQRVIRMKDSVIVSLFSGVLGTIVMSTANFLFWRKGKTEALYGHIAGSVYVRPFRTNQRKNFWLGQITHHIAGAILAYPLNLLLIKTGKDHALLKGAFFGAVTWEIVYGIGQRYSVFTTKPHMTKTHYAELLNNILYGVATAQALVTLSDPSMFKNNQNKPAVQKTQRNIVQPIYSDSPSDVERTALM